MSCRIIRSFPEYIFQNVNDIMYKTAGNGIIYSVQEGAAYADTSVYALNDAQLRRYEELEKEYMQMFTDPKNCILIHYSYKNFV